ncbi:uracil-DNA glycosylase [Arboricoccus pini]|uniref:uracil-DNA glycosylase n=1 Tax=Arboricoccus pini TaxID=1963835 RepID=UPI002AC7FC45|nr:uracil-DNA glycosylase [Arboricoccus pini]
MVAYRQTLRALHHDWFNAPVPSFGPSDARLLVVGLAPGASGANRTGRPFTGDYAGVVLYPALASAGLANERFDARLDDGLELQGARITNAVRCVPPANKPTPEEIRNCRDYLRDEVSALPADGVVLALGRIAHESVLKCLGLKQALYPFVHGQVHRPPGAPRLIDTYHTSRYNMNTGRLTLAMVQAVARTIQVELTRQGSDGH